MMNTCWILLIGLVLTFIATIIIHLLSPDIISPKIIANSYDPNDKQEFESILLKSLQKYLQKYFINKRQHTDTINKEISHYKYDAIILNDPKVENKTKIPEETEFVQNYEKTKLKITNATKISMYPDSDLKLINILSISNDRDSSNPFDHIMGEISLYKIPMKMFVENYERSEEINLENSMIKHCWSSKFRGKIVGAVSSSDKKQISVFYRVVKGPNVLNRIRYFHNVTCENVAVINTDEEIDDKYKTFMEEKNNINKAETRSSDSNSGTSSNDYFEIVQNSSPLEDCDKKWSPSLDNYFNDRTYDDFSLIGSTPIVAMTIKANVIAYARNVDYRQFYILKREIRDGQRIWKVSFIGPAFDKRLDNLFYTNSLKFVHDNNTSSDYKLLQVYITANSVGVQLNTNIYLANHTDPLNITQDDYVNTNLFKYSLNEDILSEDINKFEDFRVETSLKNIKQYMRPTVYSNNKNNKYITYEFAKGVIYYLTFSKSSEEIRWIKYKLNNNNKVNKISQDSKGENKFENTKDFTYIFFTKLKEKNKTVDYKDVISTLSLKALPNKYRNKEISSFFVENVEDKVILFLLTSDGVILSLDLTKHTDKLKKNWLTSFITELNYTAIIIMLANVLTVTICFYYSNTRRLSQERTAQLNRIVQDLLRLNNMQTALEQNLENDVPNQPAQNNPEDIVNNEVNVVNAQINVNANQNEVDQNNIGENVNLERINSNPNPNTNTNTNNDTENAPNNLIIEEINILNEN